MKKLKNIINSLLIRFGLLKEKKVVYINKHTNEIYTDLDDYPF
jgi:hypothetical protein